jgi:hypothetical protein
MVGGTQHPASEGALYSRGGKYLPVAIQIHAVRIYIYIYASPVGDA